MMRTEREMRSWKRNGSFQLHSYESFEIPNSTLYIIGKLTRQIVTVESLAQVTRRFSSVETDIPQIFPSCASILFTQVLVLRSHNFKRPSEPLKINMYKKKYQKILPANNLSTH